MYEIPATNEGEQSVLRNREAMQTENCGRTALSSQHSARAKTFRRYADFCLGKAGFLSVGKECFSIMNFRQLLRFWHSLLFSSADTFSQHPRYRRFRCNKRQN